MYSDLISTEIAPQIMTIITATHQAREQCELAAAEKSINLPEGIINSLGQHLFPGTLLHVLSVPWGLLRGLYGNVYVFSTALKLNLKFTIYTA